MKRIYLKHVGKKDSAFDSAKAWIAVGDHPVENGTPLLTSDCVSVSEVEREVAKLKTLLDDCVKDAKKHLRA